MSRNTQKRVRTVARLLALGFVVLLPALAPAQVTYTDAVSRAVTFVVPEAQVVIGDAASREATFFIPIPEPPVVIKDATSREWTFFIPLLVLEYEDAVSREVTFHIPEPPVVLTDATTREATFYFLGAVAVHPGFIGRELVKLPDGPAVWLSLAPPGRPESGGPDIFVAAATKLGGQPTDPPDDFIYRAFYPEQVERWVTFGEATADPSAIAHSPGAPWDGAPEAADVLVAVKEAPGAVEGPAIMRFNAAGVGQVVASGAAVPADTRRLRFRGTGAGGFADLLYAAADTASPGVRSLTSGGVAGGYASAPAGGAKGLAFGPGAPFADGLYLGGEGRAVYLADAAGTATPWTGDLGAPVEALAFPNEYGFAGYLYALLGDGRVVRIDPEGVAEEFMSGIMPALPPDTDLRNDLCFSLGGDRLYVTDAARGLVYTIEGLPATGVDEDQPQIPERTLIQGNVPNPFNPSTEVRFALATGGSTTLEVYDVGGRLVRRLLARETLAAGPHAVTWDGQDDSGHTVAAGVYLLRLTTPDATLSGKVMMIK
ncbi:MAG: T9SS type A sorting domain-containing protein [bacterium]|nr:T9SS type A sorting domain-containing protein [bacterium]